MGISQPLRAVWLEPPRWCNGYDVRLESERPVFNPRSCLTKDWKVVVIISPHGAKCCRRVNWRKHKLQIRTDNLHRKRRKMTEILFWAMYHFPFTVVNVICFIEIVICNRLDIHVEIVIKLPPWVTGLIQWFKSESKPTCTYTSYTWQYVIFVKQTYHI